VITITNTIAIITIANITVAIITITIITIAINTIAIITIAIITITIVTITITTISFRPNAHLYAHNWWEVDSRFCWTSETEISSPQAAIVYHYCRMEGCNYQHHDYEAASDLVAVAELKIRFTLCY
jgi:hypothetical protein